MGDALLVSFLADAARFGDPPRFGELALFGDAARLGDAFGEPVLFGDAARLDGDEVRAGVTDRWATPSGRRGFLSVPPARLPVILPVPLLREVAGRWFDPAIFTQHWHFPLARTAAHTFACTSVRRSAQAAI